jgi:hypothetical protein
MCEYNLCVVSISCVREYDICVWGKNVLVSITYVLESITCVGEYDICVGEYNMCW